MASRVGNPEVDIRVIRQVAVSAQVPHQADVPLLRGPEEFIRISPKNLSGSFQKNVLGGRQDSGNRKSDVINPVLAAHQALRHQRTVNPREHVIVESIDLAERRAHLADLRHQTGGQRGESQIALFQVHAFFSKRKEEIGARVGVHNRLKTDFGLVHFKRRDGAHRVLAD